MSSKFPLLIFIAFISAYYANVHGGTFLAMAGADSVVIASDSRFSSYQTGSVMLGQYPRQMFSIGTRIVVGCFGLDADAVFLLDHIRESLAKISPTNLEPSSVARAISDRLYVSRLMCSPIVAGLSVNGYPYICCMDNLGAISESREFAVVGTSTAGLYASCEANFRPNLCVEELVSTVEKCLVGSLERDVLSGGEVRIITITPEGIYSKQFSTSDV